MAGRKVLAMTDRQFGVLKVLWAHGPLTVRELMEHLPRGGRQPYTTVLGLLQGMEKSGLVEHEKERLTHRFRAAISCQEATRSLLSDFLVRFFHGSAEQLILGLVDAEKIGPDDLRAIESRLAEAEAEAQAQSPSRVQGRSGEASRTSSEEASTQPSAGPTRGRKRR